MHRLIVFFIIVLFPFYAGSQNKNGFDFVSLADSIQNILDSTGTPGAQIAIFSGDSIYWKGNFGFANKADEQRVTDETFFRIGSISKTFVAVAALQLVEAGQLQLDDKVSDLVPEVFIKNKFRESNPITVEHLLEHTAGFDDLHLAEYAADAEGWTLEEGVNFHPHNRTARWIPGTQMSYCNAGPPMVAYIIEKITGQNFEKYVKNNIFDPLGMANSSFVRTPEVIQRLSRGYESSGDKEAAYWHVSQRPAGSINSNVTEMASFIQMLINKGAKDSIRILNSSSVERMERCETTLAGKVGIDQGYGLHNYTVDYKGMIWHGHDGGMLGFLAKASYNREKNIGFVTLVNCTNSAIGQINRQIYEFIHASTNEDQRPAEISLTDQEKNNIVGTYKSSTSRNELFRIVDYLAGITKVGIDAEGFFAKDLFSDQKTRAFPIASNVLLLETDKHYRSPMVFTEMNGNKYAQQTNFSRNFKKTSLISAYAPLTIAGLTLLALILMSLWSIIWIPLKALHIFKKGKWSLRLLPILISLGIGVFILLFTKANQGNILENLGTKTTMSVGIFVSTVLIGLGFLLFGWARIRVRVEDESRWFRVISFIVSLLFLISFIYLFKEGLIGLRTWAY